MLTGCLARLQAYLIEKLNCFKRSIRAGYQSFFQRSICRNINLCSFRLDTRTSRKTIFQFNEKVILNIDSFGHHQKKKITVELHCTPQGRQCVNWLALNYSLLLWRVVFFSKIGVYHNSLLYSAHYWTGGTPQSSFFFLSSSFLSCFFSQNPSRWKAMSEEALKSVCAPGTTTSLPPLPPLCASSLDPAAASNQLELELRFLISEHRRVNYNTATLRCTKVVQHAPYWPGDAQVITRLHLIQQVHTGQLVY